MNREEILKKVTEKKEFSQLPKKDLLLVFENLNKPDYTDEEIVKKMREVLRKIYTSFLSEKLLNLKDKDFLWFLKKHKSTKERILYYPSLYKKILSGISGKVTIYDFGCGVNGFSFPEFSKLGYDLNYVGIEAVGQLVKLQQKFFENSKKVKFFHESLFETENLKKIIRRGSGKKIIFLFKVIDSLETLKRDYSKKFLEGFVPLVDKVVLSFATKSLGKGKRFFVERTWIKKFIYEKFKVLEEFELGGENYIVFSKKDL